MRREPTRESVVEKVPFAVADSTSRIRPCRRAHGIVDSFMALPPPSSIQFRVAAIVVLSLALAGIVFEARSCPAR
jgi:hypothetical protein